MITNAMAREITVSKDGKAEAVSYIDKATETEKRINAKAFVVAASACESARLLLNSRSHAFPDGLANSSGAVGHYLTDRVGIFWLRLLSPTRKDAAPQSRRRGGHRTCTFRGGSSSRKNDFLRGYHIEFGGGRGMPGVGSSTASCNEYEGYGVVI